MPLILEACPSFQETWDKSDDQDLLYVVMGDLARHLLTLYRSDRTDEFVPLCVSTLKGRALSKSLPPSAFLNRFKMSGDTQKRIPKSFADSCFQNPRSGGMN
jgi:hypothetical protein